MNTIKEIIKALQSIKTLKDADLDEIDAELRGSSTCIAVDTDCLKQAAQRMTLINGSVFTQFETIKPGESFKMKCSINKFVAESEQKALDCEWEKDYIKDARKLAAALIKSADRVEKAMKG